MVEQTTIPELENAVEDMEDTFRRYQVDVLFRALAEATDDQRKEYRAVLDGREAACGSEPPRFARRAWDRCLVEVDRKAAAVLGIEPFSDYLKPKGGRPGPLGIRVSLPEKRAATDRIQN
ncbi:MAG: hypothetical protein OXH68_21000 [Gammaproteobacteria bacterium]|nr:hypothetical protein [Gammaproteobacteria bacterium]